MMYRAKNFTRPAIAIAALCSGLRGKAGLIETVHGGYVFPDSNAHGEGEAPQHLYTVVFEAAELWGESADRTQTVSADAWESCLEPA